MVNVSALSGSDPDVASLGPGTMALPVSQNERDQAEDDLEHEQGEEEEALGGGDRGVILAHHCESDPEFAEQGTLTNNATIAWGAIFASIEELSTVR